MRGVMGGIQIGQKIKLVFYDSPFGIILSTKQQQRQRGKGMIYIQRGGLVD